MIILVIWGITDFLDGQIARRYVFVLFLIKETYMGVMGLKTITATGKMKVRCGMERSALHFSMQQW